jgi:arginyl-tRNA--protein-N-Asp/Glu arginylyltransferase
MSMREFEQYLKASDFFHDAMNTHRTATAEVIAGFAMLLKQDGKVTDEQLNRLLRRLGDATGRPSVDGSRRVLAARIEDTVKGRA